MKKIINSLRNHTTAIIVSSVMILTLAVAALFTLICLQYFDNLSHTASLEIIDSEFTGAIEATSDDLLFVTLSSKNKIFTEKSNEKELEDKEKDEEEERKASEEEQKAKEETEKKAKEEAEKKKKEEEKKDEKSKNNTTPQNTSTSTTNTTSSGSYYIKINKSANTITVYTKDSNGNYTVPYKAMVCSTRICFSK